MPFRRWTHMTLGSREHNVPALIKGLPRPPDGIAKQIYNRDDVSTLSDLKGRRARINAKS